MKRTKITFWLLGFGCGIVLSGIVGTICVLNIYEYKNSLVLNNIQSQNAMSEQIVKNNKFTSELEQSSQTKDNQQVSLTTDKVQDEALEALDSGKKVEVSADMSKEQTDDSIKEDTKVQVNIPNGSNAYQIATILEKQGLVEDAIAFKEFLQEKKKTTNLKNGKVSLPMHATYEELLDCLLTN